MSTHWSYREHLTLFRHLLQSLLLAIPVGLIIGSLCALFLWSLERATHLRWEHPWLLYLLPLSGVVIVWVYAKVGADSARGINLIMDEIHDPAAGVPARMAPLILVSTAVTHLFGGSAGREGTAVQIGGSTAATVGKIFRMKPDNVRLLLIVGMAAGFGGVFGTPLAAAVFAIEVLTFGRLNYRDIFPCLVGGLAGNWACAAWGIEHTQYRVAVEFVLFDPILAIKVTVAAVAFGLVSVLFSELTHALTRLWNRLCPQYLLRPLIGGGIIILLTLALGSRDYLGLGVTPPPGGSVSILTSFEPGVAGPLNWWWKLIFTAVTLSCGFKGGEVTPLFFIGATLGSVLGTALGVPVDLLAAVGLVAVFAGATNTPLACTIMGIELFGGSHAVYLAIGCFTAYTVSGHSGIYPSQRRSNLPPYSSDSCNPSMNSSNESANR